MSKLKKTQNAMNYYIDFIKSDKKRMEEYYKYILFNMTTFVKT